MMRGISHLKGEKTRRFCTMKGDCTNDPAFPIFESKTKQLPLLLRIKEKYDNLPVYRAK
jgi:hypothetical protein